MKRFIENGKCLYSIVVPEKAGKEALFAGDELVYAIRACCGDSPSILMDGVSLPENCIYIGDTIKAVAHGYKPDIKKMGPDGYSIICDGGNVFIVGAGDEGVIYGVYAFLNLVLGCEFFGYGEWYLPKIENADLPKLNVSVAPDIETRVRSLEWAIYDQETERRYGYNCGNGRHWVTWAHTFFELMPKEKYWHEHRDFYSERGEQLCITNEKMAEELTKNVIARLTKEEFEKSDLLYVMLGHEDGGAFCSCEKCLAEKTKYGGHGGAMIKLANRVADYVNDFVDREYPNKIVKIITFSYGPTTEAPVYEKEDGSYVPIDEAVIAHKNVGVMFAPLGSDWAHSLTSEKYNAQTRKSLLGWKALQPELFVWTYDSVFDDSFIYIDNWKYLAESYRTFKECGATYVFDQGHANRCFPFSDMRNYVRAKLMWNTSLDVHILIRKFMDRYYQQAADIIYHYYQNLTEHFERVEKAYEVQGKAYTLTSYVRTQPDYRSEEFWDKEFLEENIAMLEKCRKELSDTGRGGALNRLEVEMLSPIYLLMEIYGHTLEKERIKQYVSFFERVCSYNGIEYYAEHGPAYVLTVYKKLSHWRALLN